MLVTFASNVETHYMGYIVVCPAGEKAVLDKKRGGWCYIHCKLKTPSNNNNNSDEESAAAEKGYTWGTLRVPAIYLNLDDEIVSSSQSSSSESFSEDELNPLECVEYKQA